MTIEYRVFGPPGTGKTTYLGKQVRKWAGELGSDAVMVASFTRTAAAEVKGRDLPLRRNQVGTLHSFAYRALDGPELTAGKVRDFNDHSPGWRLTTDDRGDIDIDEPVAERSSTTEGDVQHQRMEVLRARRVPKEAWPESVRAFHRAWTEWKRESGLLDFTDLIEFALDATVEAPGAPDAACFDEVQDFTPLELALVRQWGQRMDRVLLAGDDDQCIYGFKGATPDAFLDPPVHDDHKRVLHQSWRVPIAVHHLASEWVQQLTRREPKDYLPREGTPGKVRALLDANFRAPEQIVREVEQHVSDGRTVMILTTCSYMLDPLKALLRREAIPFHNPYRRKRGDWNPLAPGSARRTTARDRVLAYLRLDPGTWGDDARWWIGDEVKRWADPLKSDGLFRRGAKKVLDALPGDAPFDADVLVEAFHADVDPVATLERIYQADLNWYEDHLLESRRRPFDFPLRVARTRGGAVLREDPKVVIGTIHSVKGGEADVVYLFPDLSMPGVRQWNGGPADRDEIVRQMYVGVTRTRDELVLCGQASHVAVDPSSILRHALR